MYGLKHEYFMINPKKEFQVFFARQEEFQRFYEDLLATMDMGRVPRYVLCGAFGVGKTHFLQHLKYKISDRADGIYVATPPCHRRSSFIEFYREVVSTMGRMTVTGLLREGLKSRARTKEMELSEDLAYVIDNALKEKKSFLLWKFLSGEKIKSAEADRLEAVRPQLFAEDAVAILNAIAIQHEKINKRPLLLLVDEFETTMNLGGDAKVEFTEALRSLVDEGSRVGIVFALTARSLAEMPDPLDTEPVRRRIGITNFIEFDEYKDEELERFMRQVIQYRRDSKFDVKKLLGSLQTKETVDVETFPFSGEALKEIANSVVLFKEQNKIEAVRPKEALEIMDRALRVATLRKLPFINKDIILAVRDEVVEALKV